jgi:hypothetical protein
MLLYRFARVHEGRTKTSTWPSANLCAQRWKKEARDAIIEADKKMNREEDKWLDEVSEVRVNRKEVVNKGQASLDTAHAFTSKGEIAVLAIRGRG